MRAYLGGISRAKLIERMRTGKLPGPIWGGTPADAEACWDRRAVDRALDQASGIPASIQEQTNDLDRALGFR